MSTLLEEILQEIKVTGIQPGSSCKSHGKGCGCTGCRTGKLPGTGRHKLWKERRNLRLNKKNKRIRPMKKNLLPGVSVLEEILNELTW